MSDPKKPNSRDEDVLFVTDPTTQPQTTTMGLDGKPITAGGFKVHDQWVDGEIRQFRFDHGKPLKMARATAMKFLKAGFTVRDKTGTVIKPLLTEPDDLVGKKAAFKLSFDQTVAELSELNLDALLKRVYQLPDGDRFTPESSPDEMIAFIVKKKAALAKANAGPDESKKDAANVGGAPMSPAERAAFFEATE